MSGKFQRIIIGSLFLVAFSAVFLYGARFAFFVFSPVQSEVSGTGAQGAIIEILRRENPRDLTHRLVEGGIIKADDESRFMMLGRVGRLWKKVKVGEYKLTPQMTPLEIFRVLTSGVSILHPITVREGENMFEVADALEQMGLAKKEGILKLCRDPRWVVALLKDPHAQTLEGYLFPDTYFLNKTMTGEEILRAMVRKFLAVWGQEQESRAKGLGLTRHEVITLASIIEKETGAPEERPMIGSVFYNRLQKHMRLQSDPTTIYGMWERYRGNITRADLQVENPFNTYTIPALPVGPISNPGRESIRAALYPSQSDFLYFVSHNDGTHEFTKTYDAHLAAVRKFQLDPKAREGKSWRDLNKREHPAKAIKTSG